MGCSSIPDIYLISKYCNFWKSSSIASVILLNLLKLMERCLSFLFRESRLSVQAVRPFLLRSSLSSLVRDFSRLGSSGESYWY